MGLKEYARKRDFKKTPEPPAEEPQVGKPNAAGFFCVQRHDASHLHYDFRLEVNGVLVSWAVPKGPSLDPKRKALAMKVEDHPFDYGTFEGNIPKGEYGGGSVMLWDTGTYEVLGNVDAQAQLDRGDFKFALHGTKLNGSFAIVHIKDRKGSAGKDNNWLLLKKPDEFADPDYNIDDLAWSVKTKRTQDEIANNMQVPAPISLNQIQGAKSAKIPDVAEPMLATLASGAPEGSQWLYEIKWDGIRALCRITDSVLAIYTRNGNRCEQQYPELSVLPSRVNVKEAWLDGEIGILDQDGRTRFHLMQPRIHANAASIPRLVETTPATLFLFDVLYADGYDLRGVALEDRRRILQALITPGDPIRISEAFDTDGNQMLEAARGMKLEGLLAKNKTSVYEGGRTRHWLKLKILNEQEFLIAGFTKGERDYFGSLILGVQENGVLRHAGHVGTGFDQKMMKRIRERLQPLVTRSCPFPQKPKIKDATWVSPEVVCQVSFLEWTQDGVLRAPVFVGLRTDKTSEEVVREAPAEPETHTPPRTLKKNSANAPRLNLKGKEETVEVDGHTLKLTNLEKVYFPKDGCKKRDLLGFYDRVAPFLLPHLKDRPLSLKRYPNGIHSEFFFQKNAGDHFPEWLRLHPIVEHHPPKTNMYPLADTRASLLYLANLGCIDQNPWMSRIGSLDNPDWMLLDLDPVDTSFDSLVDAALLVRELLTELGLNGYPKTTGGDGLHVYVPFDPVYTFEQVRSFAELISHLATDREPNLFTTPRSVQKRTKGRVYFDYLQIGTGKTIAAPYVVRAYDGTPVATPLDWKEVKHGLQPHDFRIDNAPERFEKLGDLFAPVLQGGQRMEDALQRLQSAEKPLVKSSPAKRGRTRLGASATPKSK